MNAATPASSSPPAPDPAQLLAEFAERARAGDAGGMVEVRACALAALGGSDPWIRDRADRAMEGVCVAAAGAARAHAPEFDFLGAHGRGEPGALDYEELRRAHLAELDLCRRVLAAQAATAGPPPGAAPEPEGDLALVAAELVEMLTGSPRAPRPLTPDQAAVYRLLSGSPKDAKEIALALGNCMSADSVRQLVKRMRRAGYRIEQRRGAGYYLPAREGDSAAA